MRGLFSRPCSLRRCPRTSTLIQRARRGAIRARRHLEAAARTDPLAHVGGRTRGPERGAPPAVGRPFARPRRGVHPAPEVPVRAAQAGDSDPVAVGPSAGTGPLVRAGTAPATGADPKGTATSLASVDRIAIETRPRGALTAIETRRQDGPMAIGPTAAVAPTGVETAGHRVHSATRRAAHEAPLANDVMGLGGHLGTETQALVGHMAGGTAVPGGPMGTGRTLPGAATAAGRPAQGGGTMPGPRARVRRPGIGPSRAGAGTEVGTARVVFRDGMTVGRVLAGAAAIGGTTPALRHAASVRGNRAAGPERPGRVGATGADRGRTVTTGAGDPAATPAVRDGPKAAEPGRGVPEADPEQPTGAVRPLCFAGPAGAA
jgi:hypothetical protein